MRRFRHGLLLSLLLSISLSAQAFTFEDWQAQQAANPAFKSRIEYSRWLAKPELRIHADGKLYFTPTESLLWQWYSPVPRIDEITISGKHFNDTSPESAKFDPLLAQNDGLPSERQVARFLIRIHQGDLESLKAKYDIQLQGKPDEWQLIMEPYQETPEALRISLEGGRFTTLISVETKTGNALRIRLSKHQPLVDGEVASDLRTALPDGALTSTTGPAKLLFETPNSSTKAEQDAQRRHKNPPKLFPRQADNAQ